MKILYRVTVFDNGEPEEAWICPKTLALQTLSEYISSNAMNKDITFKIELAQQ